MSEFVLQDANRLLRADANNIRDHHLRGLKVRKYGNTPAENPDMRLTRILSAQNYACKLIQENRVDDLDVSDLLYQNEAVLQQLPVVAYENYPGAAEALVGGHGALVLTNERIIMTFTQDSTDASAFERRVDSVIPAGHVREWCLQCCQKWCCMDPCREGSVCACCDCCISTNPVVREEFGASYNHCADRLFSSRVATVDIASSLWDASSEHLDSLNLKRTVDFLNPRPENCQTLFGVDSSQFANAPDKKPLRNGTTFGYSSKINAINKINEVPSLSKAQSPMLISEYEMYGSAPDREEFNWREHCRCGRYRAVNLKHMTACNQLSETVVVVNPIVCSLYQLHNFANEAKRVLKESSSPDRTTRHQPVQIANERVGVLRSQVSSLLQPSLFLAFRFCIQICSDSCAWPIAGSEHVHLHTWPGPVWCRQCSSPTANEHHDRGGTGRRARAQLVLGLCCLDLSVYWDHDRRYLGCARDPLQRFVVKPGK